MKLYNLDNSPYSARVRILIRQRDLPVDIVPPPVALRTDAFAQRFPLAKLPQLELDDGRSIGESAVILRYLNDIFPGTSPADPSPEARARDGMLASFADTHLAPALFPLFASLIGRADVGVESQLDLVRLQLQHLEALLASWPGDIGEPDVGDICLATVVAYTLEVGGALGAPDLMSGLEIANAWWNGVRQWPAVEQTLTEMLEAHRAFLAGL
ncbi:glutathione S-transferase family protein [Parahaliea maris]|nr:glutathione S-transferase family protein [Parahaliea maris]